MSAFCRMALLGVAFLSAGAPIFAQPARPTVVLLNGYQSSCGGNSSGSSSTFGAMESLMAADGWQVAFFDNCTVQPGTTGSARPNIEQLAQAFGGFLNRLGAPQVDVVAHSMGGLIVRSFLAGKQPDGSFSPPVVQPIRKAVFIATPHAGVLAVAGIFGANNNDSQTVEMFAGSSFLWDLATWNQRRDDMRGIDALSIAGNRGGSAGSPHSNDGAIVLTSASLAASLGPSRVRVLPYCHADNLPSFLCSGAGIAMVTDRNHPTYRIVSSFLTGSNDWESIGNDASQDAVLSKYGGFLLDSRDNLGNPLPNPGSAMLSGGALPAAVVPWNSEGVNFADYVAAGQYQIQLASASYPLSVAPGGHSAVELKAGPRIDLVAPAAATLPILTLAPGMLISVYGSNLQNGSVIIDGVVTPVYFNSGGQINTMIPAQSSGLVALSVSNAMGQDMLRILVGPAAPAIFTADGSGTGAALAFHSADSTPVSPSAPATPGEIVSILLTGLGVPVQAPALEADGNAANVLQIAPVQGAPGVIRLDFVAPQPRTGSMAVNLQAIAAGIGSNVVSLYVAP